MRGLRARSIRALPYRAPLRGALLPALGTALRQSREWPESRRWCASCAVSIGWRIPPSCATRWPRVRVIAHSRHFVLVVRPAFSISATRRTCADPSSPGRRLFAQLAAVVRVVAFFRAEGIRPAPSSSGVAHRRRSTSAGCSSFCSRCVETSRPNAPVAICHSHTALPRSSNLTRPVDLSPASAFFEDASGSPAAGLAADGFDLSLLTLPFYAMQPFKSSEKPL